MKKHRCYAEINLTNLADNYKTIQRSTNSQIIAVVKANAYGHGDKRVPLVFQECGCKHFAVATVQEALTLRSSGIVGTILLLGYCPLSDAYLLYKHRVFATLYSIEYAKCLNDFAATEKITLPCQVKIDTGMSRLGFSFDKMSQYAQTLSTLNNLHICGAYTHLSCADETDKTKIAFTNLQRERFDYALGSLSNFPLGYIHVDNTHGIAKSNHNYPYCRVGLGLYGMAKIDLPTKESMSLFAYISQVKPVKKGDSVGYGQIYTAKHDTNIATVSIGYADGVPRSIRGGFMSVGGKPAKIVAVTMDHIMLDVGGIPCTVGQYATVFGNNLSTAQVANWCNTINYEITTNISNRVIREYTK